MPTAALLAVLAILTLAPGGQAATGCPFIQDLVFAPVGDHLESPIVVHDSQDVPWDSARAYEIEIEDHDTGLVVLADWTPPRLAVHAGTADPGSYIVRLQFVPWDDACPEQTILLHIQVSEPPDTAPPEPPDPVDPPQPDPPVPPPATPGWDGICPRLAEDQIELVAQPGEHLVIPVDYAEGGTTWSMLFGDGLSHLDGIAFDTAGTVRWTPTEVGTFKGHISLVTGHEACDDQLPVRIEVRWKDTDGDKVPDRDDTCPAVPDPAQEVDEHGHGMACPPPAGQAGAAHDGKAQHQDAAAARAPAALLAPVRDAHRPAGEEHPGPALDEGFGSASSEAGGPAARGPEPCDGCGSSTAGPWMRGPAFGPVAAMVGGVLLAIVLACFVWGARRA